MTQTQSQRLTRGRSAGTVALMDVTKEQLDGVLAILACAWLLGIWVAIRIVTAGDDRK